MKALAELAPFGGSEGESFLPLLASGDSQPSLVLLGLPMHHSNL